jgi:nickel-dependent lactate racemase
VSNKWLRRTYMKTVEMPWGAWYSEETLALSFPDEWEVQIQDIRAGTPMTSQALEEAFSHPIESESIAELAQAAKTAAIAVEDLTRPTPTALPLPVILRQLKEGGIKPDRVTIIMAVGAHRPMAWDDLVKKLSEPVVREYCVVNHFPFENVLHLGTSSRGTPVWINRHFLNADVKIGMGSVLPHGLAGYGGGAKIVAPGLAGIDTIEGNHRSGISTPYHRLGSVTGNEFRAEMEEISRMAGLHLIVNAVVDGWRRIIGLFVGDFVAAHRKGVELAAEVYSTEVPWTADVGVFNSYPQDQALWQMVGGSFGVVFSSTKEVVREGGTVVLTGAAPEGEGFHALTGTAMRIPKDKYMDDLIRGFLRDKNVILLCPRATRSSLENLFFPPDTILCHKWVDVLSALQRLHPGRTRVLVFPRASIQIGPERAVRCSRG